MSPRRLLEVWEPWLQASVATSRQMLGEGWSEAYNSAPIWRFWLGAGFCGEAMLGAFMPSIDGVGRPFRSRSLRRRRGVAAAAGTRIQRRLVRGRGGDPARRARARRDAGGDRASRSRRWRRPSLRPRSDDGRGTAGNCPTAACWCAMSTGEVSLAFRAARRFGHRQAFACQSFWWTIGGEGFPPLALSEVGLPPADPLRRHADRRLRRCPKQPALGEA